MTSKRVVAAELRAKRAVAARERAARERLDDMDVAEFVTQVAKAAAVDEWLAGQERRLVLVAEERRERCRAAGGRALRAMAGRGASVKDIAELTASPVSVVQEYLAAAARAGGSVDA